MTAFLLRFLRLVRYQIVCNVNCFDVLWGEGLEMTADISVSCFRNLILSHFWYSSG